MSLAALHSREAKKQKDKQKQRKDKQEEAQWGERKIYLGQEILFPPALFQGGEGKEAKRQHTTAATERPPSRSTKNPHSPRRQKRKRQSGTHRRKEERARVHTSAQRRQRTPGQHRHHQQAMLPKQEGALGQGTKEEHTH
jgi:hypothetical protein